MSLILSTTGGKSHLIHFIDTPGHVNFVDEVATAMRLADGVLLVVDVVEGVSTLHHLELCKPLPKTSGNGQHRSHYQTRNSGERQAHTSCEQD